MFPAAVANEAFRALSVDPNVCQAHFMDTLCGVGRAADPAARAFLRLRSTPGPRPGRARMPWDEAPVKGGRSENDDEEEFGTQLITCPRAVLVHRVAYDTHAMRSGAFPGFAGDGARAHHPQTPGIRGWRSLDDLLLPYGRPRRDDVDGNDVRLLLPAAFADRGLIAVEFLRDASEGGAVLVEEAGASPTVSPVTLRPGDGVEAAVRRGAPGLMEALLSPATRLLSQRVEG